jgi:hypothetical protein
MAQCNKCNKLLLVAVALLAARDEKLRSLLKAALRRARSCVDESDEERSPSCRGRRG